MKKKRTDDKKMLVAAKPVIVRDLDPQEPFFVRFLAAIPALDRTKTGSSPRLERN